MDTCMEVSQWHDPDPFQELLERFQQLSPRIRQIDDPVAFEPLAGFRSKKKLYWLRLEQTRTILEHRFSQWITRAYCAKIALSNRNLMSRHDVAISMLRWPCGVSPIQPTWFASE